MSIRVASRRLGLSYHTDRKHREAICMYVESILQQTAGRAGMAM